MGSNCFGNLFQIMTWGESHGKAIGVVIDGCPAGLEISVEEIQQELEMRRGGKNPYVSPRQEKDAVEILSGVFEGKTTGTPISLLIHNRDIDSSKYEPIKDLLRPGHGNFTYLEKYGIFDYRGSGRASARETACRVAAGAIAKKILRYHKIELLGFIKEVGGIKCQTPSLDFEELKMQVHKSPLLCPDSELCAEMIKKIEQAKQDGDSLGGIVELITTALPAGLGSPIYNKLEANLSAAMLSLPAAKGVEFGSGFSAATMKGSEHNDLFTKDALGKVMTKTNHAGGILAGISTGMPLQLRIAFKPTSSIRIAQETLDLELETKELALPPGSRHDPCVALRAVPVVEAMGALVLVDALLMHRSSRL